MIRGIHGLFYSNKPDELRAFLRDKLQLPFTDVGRGWLIFDFPEGDLGVHPTDTPDADASGTHNISFYCDDIDGTVAALRTRGVELADPEDHGYGYVTHFTMPGDVAVQLYEPKYQKRAAETPEASKPAKKPGKKPAKKPTKKPAKKKR